MPIPVFKPFIKRRDMDAVLTCLVSDSLGPGAEADNFVEELLAYTNLDAGLALREFPRGIELALRTLELPAGARVAVPVLAPRMWEQGLVALGLQPVYIDSDNGHPGISVEALRVAHEASPLGAIVAISSLGCVPRLAEIAELGVPVIEDISQAFGKQPDPASLGGRGSQKSKKSDIEDEETETPIADSAGKSASAATVDDELPANTPGCVGAVVLVGLEPQNTLTAGGGVVVMTRSKREGVNLGKLSDELPREVYLPDMNAALGRSQMRELPQFLARREEIRELLNRALLRGRHRLVSGVADTYVVPFTFPVLVQSPVAEIQAFARKKNIETSLAFGGSILHHHTQNEDFDAQSFPHASALMMRCLLFPLYPGLGVRDIETLEKVIASLP